MAPNDAIDREVRVLSICSDPKGPREALSKISTSSKERFLPNQTHLSCPSAFEMAKINDTFDAVARIEIIAFRVIPSDSSGAGLLL